MMKRCEIKKKQLKNSLNYLKRQNFPLAKLIGFQLLSLGKGRAVCKLKAGKKHLNPQGLVHGGVLCDLADATMGYAFLANLPTKQKGVATNFQICFLKPSKAGSILTCKAKTISHGKTVFFMESEIRNASHVLIAKATSTCKTLR